MRGLGIKWCGQKQSQIAMHHAKFAFFRQDHQPEFVFFSALIRQRKINNISRLSFEAT
jgi:hypothetical protein